MVQATSESFEIWQSFIIKFFDYPDLAVVPTKIIIKDKFFDSVAIERKSVDTFTVLSLSCTHAGCTLDKVNDNLECPCHGSVFTENGCVLQGPARSSLSFYTYLFDKDKESLVVFRKAIKKGC